MRRLVLKLLICTLFIYGAYTTTAKASSPAISSSFLSDEEKAALIEKTDVQIIQSDNGKVGIQCFDVRQDGTVAVGIGSGSNCKIYVYDPQGVFQYGYRFYADGDYGIAFQDDMIGIFFLRGNTILLYDSTGICVDIQKVSNSSRNHAHIKEILNRTEKEVAGKRYVLERDIELGDSYSRLTVFDEYDKRTVLYDATTEQTTGQFFVVSDVICFFAIVFWGCTKKLKAEESK